MAGPHGIGLVGLAEPAGVDHPGPMACTMDRTGRNDPPNGEQGSSYRNSSSPLAGLFPRSGHYHRSRHRLLPAGPSLPATPPDPAPGHLQSPAAGPGLAAPPGPTARRLAFGNELPAVLPDPDNLGGTQAGAIPVARCAGVSGAGRRRPGHRRPPAGRPAHPLARPPRAGSSTPGRGHRGYRVARHGLAAPGPLLRDLF